MTTLRFAFTPLGAEFPSSAFPQLLTVNQRPVLAFDASTDESCYWAGFAPQGLTFPVTAEVHYIAASATSGAFRLQGAFESVTPADSVDLDAGDSFDTDVSNGGTVPATAGFEQKITLTFTASGDADDMAAGDYFRFRLRRDADGTSGTDDATGDMYVLGIELRDAA